MMKWLLMFAAVVLVSGNARAGAAVNLLDNPDFEAENETQPSLPAGWIAYAGDEELIAVTNQVAHSGARCVLLRAKGEAKSNRGIMQEKAVTADMTVTFTAHVLNNRDLPLQVGTVGAMNIEWLDVDGKEILRDQGVPWSVSLSPLKWQKVQVRGKAPKDAVAARFVISMVEGARPGAGSFLVDDMAVMEK